MELKVHVITKIPKYASDATMSIPGAVNRLNQRWAIKLKESFHANYKPTVRTGRHKKSVKAIYGSGDGKYRFTGLMVNTDKYMNVRNKKKKLTMYDHQYWRYLEFGTRKFGLKYSTIPYVMDKHRSAYYSELNSTVGDILSVRRNRRSTARMMKSFGIFKESV